MSLPNVIEQRDGQRETPLAIAMRRGNVEMQQLLLAAGAAPERANYHRWGQIGRAWDEGWSRAGIGWRDTHEY